MRPRTILPVLSCAESRDYERRTLGDDGAAVALAMKLAGEDVARETRELLGEAGLVRPYLFVLAGKGRNAGDALIAARNLLPDAEACGVILAGDESALAPETLEALDELRLAGGDRVRVFAHDSDRWTFVSGKSVVLDGLTGSGFRPPLSPAMKTLISKTNAFSGLVRVAVDLPSGAGDVPDDTLFRADLTVATGILKTPLFDTRVRPSAGRIRFADLHFPFPKTDTGVLAPDILADDEPLRPALADKRDSGRVLVVGGSDAMPGAALMNTLAALRYGAGLVTTACPARVQPAFAATAPEAMWLPVAANDAGGPASSCADVVIEKSRRADALLAGSGCGDSPDTLALLAALTARFPGALVLDADALRPEVLENIRKRPVAFGPVALTPHAGEFARIAGSDATPEAAREFAREAGAIIVLKGPGTWITDGVRLAFSPYGGPVLGRGGSGDLLAGMIVASLARDKTGDAFLAVCRAVARHGRAADRVASRRGAEHLRTTDILDGLR